MSKLTLLSILFFVSVSLKAQNLGAYFKLVEEAKEHYKAKEFHKSGEKYSEAFIVNASLGFTNNMYDAGCSWALAEQSDSAFKFLFGAAKPGMGAYANVVWIQSDSDLVSLHNDLRWDSLITQVRMNKKVIEESYDSTLAAFLDIIYWDDQTERQNFESIRDNFGEESAEMKAYNKKVAHLDSINISKIDSLIDLYGWLGPEKAGRQGSHTQFLVIQHANLKYQQKYLPILRTAVKNEKAKASDLALLEDRVALKMGRKQIYGSQIGHDPEIGYYVRSLEDPENVDKRRSKVGLIPIVDYVRLWNIDWSLEKYYEQQKLIESQSASQISNH